MEFLFGVKAEFDIHKLPQHAKLFQYQNDDCERVSCLTVFKREQKEISFSRRLSRFRGGGHTKVAHTIRTFARNSEGTVTDHQGGQNEGGEGERRGMISMRSWEVRTGLENERSCSNTKSV